METLDLYCERLGPGLWAEPLNASTNIAFFLSAWALWHTARKAQRLAPGVWLLIALIVMIGAGSTLFHLLATPWARLADELPILVFQLWFVWMYGRRAMGLGWPGAAVLLAAFFALALAGRQFPHVLNGSLVYAAAVVFIIGLGLYHAATRKAEPSILLWAAAVLAVSVVLRTLDHAVCDAFPTGTHFFWHLLNALVLYLAARGLLVNLPARR
jgi:hypothetical protein